MSRDDLDLQNATVQRLVAALPRLEQMLELNKVKLGLEHRSTLKSMINLARAYRFAGRREEALHLFERTLELRKATLGLEHWDTYSSMRTLALEYHAAGRIEEALPLYQQLLSRSQAELGPEHPNSLVTMNDLALALAHSRRLAEALPYLEQTLPFMIEQFGPDDSNTLLAMGHLTQAYFAGHQPEKTLAILDRYIAGQPNLALTADPMFAGILFVASVRLMKSSQYEAAENYLRQCLMIREKQFPDDWRLYNAKSALGGALAGQKKFLEAEPLLIEGYSGLKEREAQIPPRAKHHLPDAIQRLVDLYAGWEKPEQVAEWQKQFDHAKAAMKDSKTTPSNEPTK